MAVTAKLFGNFLLQALNKEHDLIDDAIQVTLHTLTYTPDQDVHDYQDDLTNEVAAGGGYSTGGQALASKTLTYTGATNKITFDAADVVWASSTITARTAVIWNNTPATAATKGLIAYQQSDVDIVSSGGNWTIQWAAAGVIELTVA